MKRENSTACLAEYAFAMELDEAPASPAAAGREGRGHFICTWQDAFSSEASANIKVAEEERPCPSRATRGGGQRCWPPGSLEKDGAGVPTSPPASKRTFAPSRTASTSQDVKG